MAHEPRQAALAALHRVCSGHQTLDDVLPAVEDFDDSRDAGLARALCFGVLRWHPLLISRLNGYLRKPLKPRDNDIQLLMMIGLFQLGWTRQPAHAAIHATVEVCRGLGKPWAAGLINGVLRSFQRDGCPMDAPDGAAAHTATAHPQWLYDRLATAWPDQLDSIIGANNEPGPMWLRVNSRQGSRDDYLATLRDAGIDAAAGPHGADAICLSGAVDVSDLPGFAAGRVSVQDAAAQLAAELLAPAPGARVLDACAAPGGKAAHLLERNPEIVMTALDLDGARARRVEETFQRLGLNGEVRCADALDTRAWWDGQPLDAILLDAPCSATGVIRRHPDIKLLRRDSDIANLSRQQGALLNALWPLLKRGGRLLYATCSVLPDENEGVVGPFLANNEDAEIVPLDVAWGAPGEHGRQILPGEGGMDGFYYALLARR